MCQQLREAPRVFAIVPAAGRSRRMGDAKQLLDVGGQTMLSAVLKPLSASRVEGIVLVTRSAIAESLGAEQVRDVLVAINDDDTSEMIDSIRIGLSTWRRQTTVRDCDGFLVCHGAVPPDCLRGN